MMKNLFQKAAVTLLTATAVGVCALSFGNDWDNAVVTARAEEPEEDVAIYGETWDEQQILKEKYFYQNSPYTILKVLDAIPEGVSKDKLIDVGKRVYLYADETTGTVYIVPEVAGETIYAPESCHSMFWMCQSMEECDLSGMDWSHATEFDYMFSKCYSLKTISLNGWNTSSVTDMGYLFDDCKSLEYVDLSGINTSNVTTMSYMFEKCEKLTEINFGDKTGGTFIDTSNVKYMASMFSGCKSMTTLYLTEFDTSSVTEISSIYSNCDALTKVDLSGLYLPKVQYFTGVFGYCPNLTEVSLANAYIPELGSAISMFIKSEKLEKVDLSGINAPKLTNLWGMFEYCSALKSVDFSGVQFGSVTDMGYMFYDCKELQTVNLSDINTEKVTDMSYLFANCQKLQSVNITGWSFASVEKFDHFLYECRGLKSIDFSNVDFGAITSFDSMLSYCTSLESADFTNAKIPNVTSFSSMFFYDSALKSVSFEGVDTSNVQSFASMFYYCEGLDDEDFANLGFDTSAATNMNSMFNGCTGMTEFDLSAFDMTNVENVQRMFANCTNLRKLNFQGTNLKSVTNMLFFASSCNQLESVDFSGCGLSAVADFSSAFSGCTALKKVVFDEKFDQVTTMSNMFYRCSSIEQVDLSGFSGHKVTSLSSTFSGATSLTNVNMCSFDFSNITKDSNLSNMFTGCTSLNEICVSRDAYDRLNSLNVFSAATSEVMLHKDANEDHFCDICQCYLGRQEYLAGTSLMLGSKIGVNFYFGLGEEVCADEDAYVKFSLPDGTEQIVYVKDAQVNDKVVPGEKYHVFPCYITPFYYASDVYAKLYFSDGSTGERDYSFNLKQYGDAMISDTTGAYSEECKNLVEAMIDYCTYDYIYFAKENKNPKQFYFDESEKVYNALKPTCNLPIENEDFVGASLITNSQLILRLYFSKDFEGSCGQKGDYYYVQYAVAPTQFDVKDPIAGYSVNDYLCYCSDNTTGDSPYFDDYSLAHFCVAIYRYEMAAKAYQASINR